jgi:hypothetical protein
MAFGQRSGPPATARQVQELLRLLNEAGHTDFRDARGPMGFTQRQAGGAFTRDEAEALIDQLLGEGPDEGAAPTAPATAQATAQATAHSTDPAPATNPAPAPRQSARERMLQELPADQLARELRRRGWTTIEP